MLVKFGLAYHVTAFSEHIHCVEILPAHNDNVARLWVTFQDGRASNTPAFVTKIWDRRGAGASHMKLAGTTGPE